MPHCKEADWKLFKEKIIVWQRNYIEKQNQKLIKILSDEKLSPEERFSTVKAQLSECPALWLTP